MRRPRSAALGRSLHRDLVISAFLGVTLVGAGTLACGKKGDPVRATIERIVRLAEKGDADGISPLLSGGYRDAEGQGRDEALFALKRYLAVYENLTVRLSDLTVETRPDIARATFLAAFSGSPRKAFGLDAVLPRGSRWRFEVNLRPEEGTWKVTWVSWSAASGGPG